jgi:hypothetical protein
MRYAATGFIYFINESVQTAQRMNGRYLKATKMQSDLSYSFVTHLHCIRRHKIK